MRRFLPLMLAYGAVALGLTWPLVLGLGTAVPGVDRTELWTSMWSMDFVAQALAEGRMPVHTTRLGFPGGGTVLVDDLLGAFLMAPITLLAGVNVAITALVWLQLAFAGVMAHGFAREWLNWRSGSPATQRAGAAWVAGLGFCSAPILLSAVHNGEVGALGGGWGVWSAWMCWRAAARGGRRRLELAVASLALAALSGWSGAATAFVFAGALAAVGAGDGLRRHLRTRVLVFVLGLAVAVPLGYSLQEIARDGESLQPPESTHQAMTLRRSVGAADPLGFVKPGAVQSTGLGLESSSEDRRVRVHYLGWGLLGLGVLGFRRSRRGVGFVLLGGGVGLILALGPVLVSHGEPLLIAGQKVIPLPYLLVEGLPGFDALTNVYRLAQAAALALALLAAAGVAGRKIRWQLAALTMVVLEGQFVAPTASLSMSTRISMSPAIDAIAQAPQGAVLNFPVVKGRSYVLEQVHHGKPMIGGLSNPDSEAAAAFWAEVIAYQERDPSWTRVKISSTAKRLGIRYVLIHVDPDAQPDMHDTAIQILERAYLPMTQEDSTNTAAPAARVLKLW